MDAHLCLYNHWCHGFFSAAGFFLPQIGENKRPNQCQPVSSFLQPHQTDELTVPGKSSPAGLIAFRIPVEGFESKNPLLTKDFNRFMQAETHPYIQVRIKKSQLHQLARGKNSQKLPLQIHMAGKTQQVESRYLTRHYPSNQMLIEGRVQVNLEDFNLEPPQKMMGLVQVKDKIFINFDVVLSSQQTALNK